MRKYFALLLILVSIPLSAQPLRVVSGEWTDFAEFDGSGIYWQLLREIYPDVDWQLHPMPFNRALNEFANGQADAIIGVYREDVSQAILPSWHVDMEGEVFAFYDKRVINLKSRDQINEMFAAWIRGYRFDKYFHFQQPPYLLDNQQMAFQMLEKKRIDVFLDYSYYISERKADWIGQMPVIPSKKVYLAFKQTDQGRELARQFDRRMTQIRASGRLAQIYGSYYDTSGLDSFHPEEQKIIWLSSDPELSLGGYIAKGISTENDITYMLFDTAEHIEFEVQFASNENMEDLMRNTPNMCATNKIITQKRQQSFLFSSPQSLFLGLKLFRSTHVSNQPMPVNQDGQIDLAQLFEHTPGLKIGISRSRSYGPELDEQIARLDKKHVVMLDGDSPAIANLQALVYGNVDYVIEYPETLENFRRQLAPESKLEEYSISGAKPFVVGHVMCSKSDIGVKSIFAINQALSEMYQSDAFLQAHLNGLPKASQEFFKLFYKQVFKPGN